MYGHEKPEEKLVRMVRKYFASNPEEKKRQNDEPEDPRPQDCCGLSCNPCIFDLHQQDIVHWAKECARSIDTDTGKTLFEDIMGVEEEKHGEREAFSRDEYHPLNIIAVESLNACTKLFRFKVDVGRINLPLGCHLIASRQPGTIYSYLPACNNIQIRTVKSVHL
ncbi:unnamed protein product, partial [Mesorhabditis spiculigera]